MQHHAFLVFAPSYDVVPVATFGDSSTCEVTKYEFEQMSITEVRRLKDSVALFPSQASIRRFVIETNSIASQAQHALLKLLEEPVTSTQFVLVLKERSPLLETIYSRVSFLGTFDTNGTKEDQLATTAFWEASYGERMALITDWSKKLTTQQLRSLLCAIARQSTEKYSARSLALGTLSDVTRYAQTSGARPKMLLEEIALTVPVEKR